ncbi:MAG: murein biosynthesis integral membrane protein MurJ [Bryobacteraceae bacterium]
MPASSNSTASSAPAAGRQEKLFRSAGLVSFSVLISRLSGMAREMIMARLFGGGAGPVYDAFLLGFRIPNLTRDLFAEGALSSAFVPTFTSYLATKNRQEAARLANLVATAILLAVGGFCLLGIVFSPALVHLLAPGFDQVPGKHELAVRMTRIMFPFLLLVALAAQAMGMLNACNQFAVPAFSSTFFNLGSIFFGLALGFWAGPWLGISAIEGMAYGVVLGGALQLASQIPSLRRQGFHFRLAWDWSHPGLRQILSLMGPAMLGNAAVQVNVLVNTNLATGIVDRVTGLNGPVSWLSYAFRFMQLPLGLFGVAIATATLPAVSLSAAQGNLEEFRRTLSRSLGMVFLLTIPSSIGLAVLGETMIGVIYEGGKFQAYDTHQTAVALSFYAVGLAGYAAIKVLAPAFYALNDSRTPMLVSLMSIAVNYVAATTMVRTGTLGHAGLALATSVVALANFVALFWLLRNRLRGIHGRALASSVARISAAAGVMGLLLIPAESWLESWLGVARWGRLLSLSISVPAGAAVFYQCCRWMRVSELEMARRALLGPLGRWAAARRDRI